MVATQAVRAVLWDADGVLQHQPDGWRPMLDGAGGPGFAEALFAAEGPALRGEARLRDTLADVLRRFPEASVDVADLLVLWERAVLDEDAMALVGEVRAAGVLAVLATNQQDHRRGWMRDDLGVDRHFDAVFYSCEMGVVKPDPAYFRRILADLDLPAGSVAFVDDSAANVEAARALGLRAVLHVPTRGAGALRTEVQSLLGER